MSGLLDAPAAPPSEGREHRRYRCDLPTTCQPPNVWGPKEPWPATIRDISTGGLSLALARRFERGSGLAIELPQQDGSTATVLARVAHVRPQPQGGWVLGCNFVSALSDEEVRAVIDQAPVADSPEAPPGVPPAGAWAGGVYFEALWRPGVVLRGFVRRPQLPGAWPPAPGKEIGLRFGPPDAGHALDVVVGACYPQEGGWVVTAAVVTPPAPETLRALGCPNV